MKLVKLLKWDIYRLCRSLGWAFLCMLIGLVANWIAGDRMPILQAVPLLSAAVLVVFVVINIAQSLHYASAGLEQTVDASAGLRVLSKTLSSILAAFVCSLALLICIATISNVSLTDMPKALTSFDFWHTLLQFTLSISQITLLVGLMYTVAGSVTLLSRHRVLFTLVLVVAFNVLVNYFKSLLSLPQSFTSQTVLNFGNSYLTSQLPNLLVNGTFIAAATVVIALLLKKKYNCN